MAPGPTGARPDAVLVFDRYNITSL